MVNRAATGAGNKKRSVFQRAIDNLEMNTARSAAYNIKRKTLAPNAAFNPSIIPREGSESAGVFKGASVAKRYVIVDDLTDPDP